MMIPARQIQAGLAALLAGPRWDYERLVGFRQRCFRELVGHAVKYVPYYRERDASCGLPSYGSSLEELLGAVPITRKTDVQARRPVELVAAGVDPDRLVIHTTSGSTGRPFTIRRTPFEERLLLAFRLRANFALGLRPLDRRVKITFLRRSDGFAPASPRPPSWYARLGLLRQEQIHCLLPPQEMLRCLLRIRPQSLGGYPSALVAVTRAMTSADRLRLRPRVLWTAGETLTDEARREIEAGLGARVIDQYGTHEANLLAVECPLTGYLHVLDDAVIVEVVRDGHPVGQGKEGEVVITPLHSFAMPLVRFALGDVAVAGPTPCPCGARVTTLERLVGRTVELFRMADGTHFHPYRLAAPLLAAAPWLRQFQVSQESHALVVVRVVPWETPGSEELQAARKAVEEAADGHFQVRLDLVQEIVPSRGGKAQPYRSALSSVPTDDWTSLAKPPDYAGSTAPGGSGAACVRRGRPSGTRPGSRR